MHGGIKHADQAHLLLVTVIVTVIVVIIVAVTLNRLLREEKDGLVKEHYHQLQVKLSQDTAIIAICL